MKQIENAKEMKIEMIGMEEYLGTADILRSIKDKLKVQGSF